MGFEDQIPGGPVARDESPGEEAQRIADELVPFIASFGLKLNTDAVASVVRDVLRWWRQKD